MNKYVWSHNHPNRIYYIHNPVADPGGGGVQGSPGADPGFVERGGGAQRRSRLKTLFGILKGGGAGGVRPLWPSLKTLFGISKGGARVPCAPPPESASEDPPPPFVPRCRLSNIGPKIGPPSGPPFFAGRPNLDPPPLSKILDPPLISNINSG